VDETLRRQMSMDVNAAHVHLRKFSYGLLLQGYRKAGRRETARLLHAVHITPAGFC
jgi:hypothetical protein